MRAHDPYSRLRWRVRVAILALAVLAVAVPVTVYLSLHGTVCADCGDPYPAAVFRPVTSGPANVTVELAAVSMTRPLSSYAARLSVDGIQRAVLSPLADGAGDWLLTFHDRSGGGYLNGGDWFRVDTVSPGDYELLLFYGDSRVATATWVV